MTEKTMLIMFPKGGIIPASVLGLETDKHCQAHETVEVPETYGQHLVHDRFAVEASDDEDDADDVVATKKTKRGKPGKEKPQADTDNDEQTAAKIADAEKKVEAAEIAVANAGTDTVALDKASGELATAEAELAALKE
jgi:hypothetical protein